MGYDGLLVIRLILKITLMSQGLIIYSLTFFMDFFILITHEKLKHSKIKFFSPHKTYERMGERERERERDFLY